VIFYQSLLESADIPTFIKNENISTAEGVAIPEFFPALCVVNDEDYDKSVAMIQSHLGETDEAESQDVVCPACGEMSPGNFTDCWNCGAPLLAGGAG
jgi:hypothetical protein